MSRLRAVGLYHDLDFNDHQQEFSVLFDPLPPVALEVNEVSIAPNIEKFLQNCDTLHDLPTAQTDKAKLSIENTSPTDIPQLEQNLLCLYQK